MNVGRRLILLRKFTAPFSADNDFTALNTFPVAADGNGVTTPVNVVSIPREVASIRAKVRFVDENGAPVAGTVTLQAIDKAKFEYDASAYQVIASAALTSVGNVGAIEEVQETDSFSMRVSSFSAAAEATEMYLYIQAYQYETGVDR